MSSSLHFRQANLDTSPGPVLIGGLISTALWGVTCVQTYTYFTRKSRDGPAYKAIIAFLFVLDVLDSVLLGHFLYFYLITHSTNPIASLPPPWSCTGRGIVSFLSDFIIRMMFGIRVYKFSQKNLILIIWITMISLIPFAFGLYSMSMAFQIHSYAHLEPPYSIAVYVIFSANVVADLSIAISLCYLLYRSRTGFRRTDLLIRTLMVYTVNTGVIVALDTTFLLTTFVTMPQSLIYDIPYLPLVKLHLNAYLACLNAREAIQEKLQMQDLIFVESELTCTPGISERS
ncbi:hypothetical protein BDN72DRAFT_835949 [Pluteus cervinus]|uniref:Uncharacterized protein n=1 Tax=Pluteus cervinus TaxID=181527 RepID=A0ACD3B3L2_9AGAR|nr:hypothetical protein BDN72DRAFT_835949 [Pluteus cervinus]